MAICRFWLRGSQRQKQARWIALVTFTTLFFYIYIKYVPEIEYVYLNRNLRDPCILPNVDPFDPAIRQYLWSPDPIACEQTPSLVFINASGYLYLNKTAIQKLGLKDVTCGYSIIKRKGDYDVEVSPEVMFSPMTYLPTDIALIKCYQKKDKLVYEHIHLNVDYKSVLQNRKLQDESKQQLSIYIFGLDSVSRLNAERKLTKTMKFLREELQTYVFEGHTKVGENTFPNLVAMLLGRKAYSSDMVPFQNKYWHKLNDYPFLWRNFSDAGYVTYFTEDSPQMSTFMGFEDQPCDHYIRHFFLALRKLRSYKIHDVFMFLENQRIKLTKSSTMCYGSKPKQQLVVEFLERMFRVYDKKRKFMLSWLNELTHDFLNFLELADDDVFSHFKWLKESGNLENAVLIFMSDHGLRVNEVRNTVIGRIEDRMPLFSVVLPEHLIQKYPHLHKNMLINTKRLTTNWDVYATLEDVLTQNFQLHAALDEEKSLPRGISLFREIPKRRTCFEADIQEHYCPCYSSKMISTNDSRVVTISKFVVNMLNHELSIFPDVCARLTLNSIQSAHVIDGGFQRVEEMEEFSFKKLLFRPKASSATRILVVVKTAPSGGLFEATVSYTDRGIRLLGDITRINKYGNQSSCIEHKILRSSCYCM